MSRIALALAVALTIGCTRSMVDGFALPVEARQGGGTFAVYHQPDDGRRLDLIIVRVLRERGLNAVSGPSPEADYSVTYIDRWYWDMRMYLTDLRIDVRHADTNVLLATGRSYQDSFSAMGETHESVIEKAVDVLIAGAAPGPR